MERPLLPIGYTLKENITIKSRINSIYHCEVYELSNDTVLYIYRDITKDKTLNKKLDKYENIIINIGGIDYIGILAPKFIPENILKYKKDLTELVGFEKIAGMKELKTLFTEEVINPLRYPEKYEKYKLGIPNGILLFGPPGCGKTYITRRLAEELGFEFLEIKHSDVGSPYIHGSVGKIGEIFLEAKEKAPCIVFIDEISALVPKRESLESNNQFKEEEVDEILMHLNDAAKNKILVVGATNFPDRIDTAVQRSGRMDRKIYIGPPDEEARVELFRMYFDGRPISKDIDYIKLSKLTENFVTSDIELICEDSARRAFRENTSITMDIALDIINSFKPSIGKNELEYFTHENEKNIRRIGFNTN